MQTLTDILYAVSPQKIVGDTALPLSGLTIDSRKAAPGIAFITIKGTIADGHSFIAKAIEQGCDMIICEVMPADIQAGVCYVQVADTAEAAGHLAAAFYGNPSAGMIVVGVTGTNGKTTTATLLYSLFKALGYRCGLISTVQNHIGDTAETATHTTPDAISIQSLLAKMKAANCSHVFMEVSSHAVHQQRIAGIHFTGGVFTNITHDHLDYHKTFEEYIRVKKRFFDGLPEGHLHSQILMISEVA